MKNLNEILRLLGVAPQKNTSVRGLSYDSRKTRPGDLFFAVPGFKEDGSVYIAAAQAAGAVAAIVAKDAQVPPALRAFCYAVGDVRKALAEAADFFFDHPSAQLDCFGVTGTKGKTSSGFLLEAILNAANKPAALAGTVLARYPGHSEPTPRTTLESLQLQQLLRAAVGAGAEAAVLEVSSHALSLARVHALQFRGVLFTNLSLDHQDFYGDMESYFQAKLKLFTDFPGAIGMVNGDDLYGRRVLQEAKIPVQSFGLQEGDYTMPDAAASAEGITGTIHCPGGEKIRVRSPLVGNFNIANILGAAALLHAYGLPAAAIEKGIAGLNGIPGRVERVPTTLPFQVFVDFAHNGLALENVLQTLRPFCRGKLTVLFGAGGDKDPIRRPQLGKAAANLADEAWVTADNPRSEDPLKIIAAIMEAFTAVGSHCQAFIEPDRAKAVEGALRRAQPGDILCFAGKGHESGQTVGTVTFPFDDRVEAAKVLRQLEAERANS